MIIDIFYLFIITNYLNIDNKTVFFNRRKGKFLLLGGNVLASQNLSYCHGFISLTPSSADSSRRDEGILLALCG